MRLLLFCFLFPLYTIGQNNRSDTVDIAVACGFAGISSKEVDKLGQLHFKKNYSLIRERLFQDNRLMQMLSAILLLEYESKKIITITNKERVAIEEITNSSQRYSICFTCTYQNEGTLKQLFSTQNEVYDRDIILRNILRER